MEESRIHDSEMPNAPEHESIHADAEEARARRRAVREWLANFLQRIQQSAQTQPKKKQPKI